MPRKSPVDRPIVPGVRRRCDNCPRFYIPKKSDHRFHSPECRADYHKFGPVLLRLRDRIDRAAVELFYRFWKCLDAPSRARFKAENPEQAAAYEARSANEL